MLDQSIKCRGAGKIVIRKSLESLTDSSCRGGVEQAFQNSFSKGEKHRHECNQACNSTNDPINILSSQNHPSTIIFKHMDLKNTHTHTTSLTNFIFQKPNQDSLVSIH